MSEEDRAFLSEVSSTLKRLSKEAKRPRFSTLGYMLEMIILEGRDSSANQHATSEQLSASAYSTIVGAYS